MSEAAGPARVVFVVPGDLGTPTGGYGYDRRLIGELRAFGWEVEHLPLGGEYPFPDGSARAEAGRALAGLPEGATVLIDGLAFSALPGEMAAEAGRLRLVALIHHPLGDESGLDAGQREALWASERRALAVAAAVVCTSPATAARLVEAFGVPRERITVAPPGTERARRAAGAGDPPLILAVGSLIPRKRHDVLIDALARLRDRRWRARIVGSDQLDPACARALADRIAGHGLGARITLGGAVVDTREEMAGADIFALASEYEGYGMAFAEAMTQGLPVVACRAGAIAELVPEAAGGLVPVGDAGAFAAALARLLDDRDWRAGCAAASWQAGLALPGWRETAERVAGALR